MSLCKFRSALLSSEGPSLRRYAFTKTERSTSLKAALNTTRRTFLRPSTALSPLVAGRTRVVPSVGDLSRSSFSSKTPPDVADGLQSLISEDPVETSPVKEHEETILKEVAADLFHQYAKVRNDIPSLDVQDIENLLREIGEEPTENSVRNLFSVADYDNNGVIDLEEFLEHYDFILGGNPARIILVVGGPGSGKGVLSQRLQDECHVVHLSSGDLLRTEIARGSSLGRQVQDIMARGELVSSAIMVALMKRRMRDHPGKRVLLDGFPRSLENAHDLVALCGTPELALHLVCDDTVLMERIIGRGADLPEDERRPDDNFQTALQRLRTFHKYHHQTMEWLREAHIPIVNLDCSGSPNSVWSQLQAIGRLMRPAVKIPAGSLGAGSATAGKKE